MTARQRLSDCRAAEHGAVQLVSVSPGQTTTFTNTDSGQQLLQAAREKVDDANASPLPFELNYSNQFNISCSHSSEISHFPSVSVSSAAGIVYLDSLLGKIVLVKPGNSSVSFLEKEGLAKFEVPLKFPLTRDSTGNLSICLAVNGMPWGFQLISGGNSGLYFGRELVKSRLDSEKLSEQCGLFIDEPKYLDVAEVFNDDTNVQIGEANMISISRFPSSQVLLDLRRFQLVVEKRK
jgi:hypothetical protein